MSGFEDAQGKENFEDVYSVSTKHQTNTVLGFIRTSISSDYLNMKERNRSVCGISTRADGAAPEALQENVVTESDGESSADTDCLEAKEVDVGSCGTWTVCDFRNLPDWMQDNDCLISGYRPPLVTFSACFMSIFRMHTETVNIWTHLIGCIAFLVLAVHFTLSPVSLQEKLLFGTFFLGAILCLGFSFIFHTFHCHSPYAVKLFSRLDYCGIGLLIIGSYIPWLYYGFYCRFWPKLVYLSVLSVTGACAVVVSCSDSLQAPSLRPLRAAVFTSYALTGVIPAVHFILVETWPVFLAKAASILFTAALYIIGAVLYAYRVPERLYPGRFDLWFQSHQIFHVLVVIATLINYQGLVTLATSVREGRS
ncbi:Adiponectin receptor protein 2 [Homalodisca vitripennis]|nr:Adiponectin receptor protein 2 [Homalodisca vitripennis]